MIGEDTTSNTDLGAAEGSSTTEAVTVSAPAKSAPFVAPAPPAPAPVAAHHVGVVELIEPDPAEEEIRSVDGAASLDLPPVLDWTKGALILASGSIPSGETRPVIVVERVDDESTPIAGDYPADGAIYLRHAGPEDAGSVEFGVDPSKVVWTLGVNAVQGTVGGVSLRRGVLAVVPAHMAYAAISVAAAEGARDIEIAGLTPVQKERLQPWVDDLAAKRGVEGKGVPEDLSVTLS